VSVLKGTPFTLTVPSWNSQTGEVLNPLAGQLDADPGCRRQ